MISNSLKNNWANPSGIYEKSKQSKTAIEEARIHVATMLNCESSSDIVFTSGGTEANNMVFHSMIKHFHKQENNEKPHFIISSLEHDSVKLAAEYFMNNNMAELSEIPTNKNGIVNITSLIDSIKPNTVLISLMLANNETGVIQPVKFLSEKLKELGYNIKAATSRRIFIHTDAAQAIGKIEVDVQDLDIDYLTIVGHKFYGPRIGALYARKCLSTLEFEEYIKAPIYPLLFGGNQERSLRPGTENTPMIVGLGKAAELVTKNLKFYRNHMKQIRDYLENLLEDEFGLENLHFNGRMNTERLPNTCNVSFLGSDKFTGKKILNHTKYLEASTGACCHSNNVSASRILLAMNIPIQIAANSIRLSVGRETQKEDINLIIQDLKETINKF